MLLVFIYESGLPPSLPVLLLSERASRKAWTRERETCPKESSVPSQEQQDLTYGRREIRRSLSLFPTLPRIL